MTKNQCDHIYENQILTPTSLSCLQLERIQNQESGCVVKEEQPYNLAAATIMQWYVFGVRL